MTISRIKPAGWSINEKLTSVQVTELDINTSYGLDKRDGYSDTVDSTIFVDNGSINFSAGSSLSSSSIANINLNIGTSSRILVSDTGVVETISGGRIVLGDNDYPTFSVPRTIIRTVPIVNEAYLKSTDFIEDYSGYAAKSIRPGAELAINLNPYLIEGAILNSFSLSYYVSTAHSAFPEYMPKVLLGKTSLYVIINDNINLDIPSSGLPADWFGLKTQSFNCKTTYNIINKSNNYVFYFKDEEGGNAFVPPDYGIALNSIQLNMSISDMRI